MVSFRFRLTDEEYYRYSYYTAWAAPSRRRYRILYFLRVIVLYGAVAFLYILVSRTHLVWIDISVFAITGLLYLFFIPFFVRKSVRRKVADVLSKKENLHVLDEAEVVISETGIIDRDTVSESKYAWDAIVHYADTPDGYYLYTNSNHAIVIPKRVIQNELDRTETERLLDKHLPLQA